jgi:hypothetical protein
MLTGDVPGFVTKADAVPPFPSAITYIATPRFGPLGTAKENDVGSAFPLSDVKWTRVGAKGSEAAS